MKNCIITVICMLALSCNFSKEDSELNITSRDSIIMESGPIRFLDSNNYMGYYNQSKWKIYLKYCDYEIIPIKKNNAPKYFGEYDVTLFSADLKNDTLLSLLFQAKHSDSNFIVSDAQFEDSSIRYKYYMWHYYDVKHKSFYGYGFDQIIKIDSLELNNYCNNKAVCNKKEFIETHRRVLNKWFIKEAVRQKFIE